VPLGHTVNANIAMTTGFSLHHDHDEAVARGQLNFDFFSYAMSALIREEIKPGRTNLWEDFLKSRDKLTSPEIEEAVLGTIEGSLRVTPGIGTPAEFIEHVRELEASGVDQVIFVQQAGRMKHEHICHSLELFATDVLPHFAEERAAKEARKREELAPYIEAAMKRKKFMEPLRDEDIPVVLPSRPKLTEVIAADGKAQDEQAKAVSS